MHIAKIHQDSTSLFPCSLRNPSVHLPSIHKMGESARAAVVNPRDAYSMGQVVSAGQATSAAVKALLAESPEAVLDSVAYWSKAAATKTSLLIAATMPVQNKDPALASAIPATLSAVTELVSYLRHYAQGTPNAGPGILSSARAATVPISALLGASQQAQNLLDPAKRAHFIQTSSEAQDALQKLATALNAVASSDQRDMSDAIEQLRAITVDLDVACIAA